MKQEHPQAHVNDPVATFAMRREDLFLLLVCAYRYAAGRMSYVTSSTAQAICHYWSFLSEQERRVLLRDVTEDVTAAEERGALLGMEMDHAMWRDLKKWMEDHLHD